MRSLPFSGVEWSYQMRDLGFNERGILEKPKDDDIEMTELDTIEKEIEI